MDFLKRHGFLLGLVAGTVVLSVGLGLFFHLTYRQENMEIRGTLESAVRRGRGILQGPIFTEAVVEEMAARVETINDHYWAILEAIREQGAALEPLVPGLLPVSTRLELRHRFRAEYSDKLKDFFQQLGAANPTPPQRATADEAVDIREQAMEATMYAHPELAFVRPGWVDRPEAPSVQVCRLAQEDAWLMQDLVDIIARANRELGGGRPVTVKTAPIKELVEIRIGAEGSVLGGTEMAGSGGRYRGPGRVGLGLSTETDRQPTVTGIGSVDGFYRALPWRLVVVMDAARIGDLLGRLRGTPSHLMVEAWRMRPVTEGSIAKFRDLLAESRLEYGMGPVARLEVVGTALIFQLEGGRITVVPGEGTVVQAPGAEVEAGGDETATP